MSQITINERKSTTLQASLNRLMQGYNLSEMSENDEKLERALLFDDYLLLTSIISQIEDVEEE